MDCVHFLDYNISGCVHFFWNERQRIILVWTDGQMTIKGIRSNHFIYSTKYTFGTW